VTALQHSEAFWSLQSAKAALKVAQHQGWAEAQRVVGEAAAAEEAAGRWRAWCGVCGGGANAGVDASESNSRSSSGLIDATEQHAPTSAAPAAAQAAAQAQAPAAASYYHPRTWLCSWQLPRSEQRLAAARRAAAVAA